MRLAEKLDWKELKGGKRRQGMRPKLKFKTIISEEFN
jgi:hypothetical protein